MFYIIIILLALLIVSVSMIFLYVISDDDKNILLQLFLVIFIISTFIVFTFACFIESEQRTLDNVANGVKYEKVDGKWKELKPEEPEEVKTINQ